MTHGRWQLHTQSFILQKSCSDFAECEDAIGINAALSRFAVVDGATEAFDARNWATLLAESWVEDETATVSVDAFRSCVAEQSMRLHAGWHGRALSWYAEEKARSGSYAAFVGVQFDLNAKLPRWQAIALGDCCLIHLRKASIEGSFPLIDDEQFTSSPVLVPSLESMRDAALSKTLIDSGTIENEDVFLLLSDSVAAWYLKQAKQRDVVCDEFDAQLAASQHDELTRLFQRERLAHRIKDDDIAVLRIAASHS